MRIIITLTIIIVTNHYIGNSQNIYGEYKSNGLECSKSMILSRDSIYEFILVNDIQRWTTKGKYVFKNDTLILDTNVGVLIPHMYVFEDSFFLREAIPKYETTDSLIIINSFYEFKKIAEYDSSGNLLAVMNWYSFYTPQFDDCDHRIRDGEWIFYNNVGQIIKKLIYKKGKLKKIIKD